MVDDLGDALLDSDERYRTLFELAPVGVFICDRGLRVLECNRRFVDLLQASYERLIGFDIHRVNDPSVLPAIERAIEGDPSIYEGPYRATNGPAHVHICLRVTPMRDADGVVVAAMGIVDDITARVTAEAALRRTEQRLATHIARSPIGVITWSVDGKVTEWNDAAARIFGYPAAEMLGKSGALITPERWRGAVMRVWRRLLANAGGEHTTNENVTKDGRVILCDWYNTPVVDAEGEVVAVTSLVADVTERRAAEDALKRSEARFRELIEHIPESIAVSREGRFVYVNPAFVSYLGHDRAADLHGTALADVTHPDDRPMLDHRRAQILAGNSLPPYEYRLIRRDGSLVTAEINSVPTLFDGEPSVIAVARDVSDRKHLQLQLLQADRMASVGALAAGVAHEINNPLAYLMSNLEVSASRKLPELTRSLRSLEETLPLREREGVASLVDRVAQLSEMIDVAREGAERVRDIVRDLKTFSRTDDVRRGPVDVRRVLDASINMAWNEIRHRARLVKEYGEVPPVEANESRLGQVFLNLLVNAAQALQVGSAADHEIRVRVLQDAQRRVTVEVSDTGPGIPRAIIARIFDPFFTTKPMGVGTGLGLWICQGIVTAVGGSIDVRSTVAGEAADDGQGALPKPPLRTGTTFTVTLPSYSYSRDQEGSPTSSSSPPAIGRRGRVLVIDDEIEVARAIRNALSDSHDVVITASGREALELLHEDDRFDVVLCDLMMPDVTGMELFETLRSEGRSVTERFVFVTGGAFTGKAREFLDRVDNLALEKPFEMERLRELVRGKAARAATQ